MVLINTEVRTENKIHEDLEFRYFLQVPRGDCVFCSGRDGRGRVKLFLAFNGHGPIYRRNGRKGTWEALRDTETHEVREILRESLENKNVPCYSTDNHNILN